MIVLDIDSFIAGYQQNRQTTDLASQGRYTFEYTAVFSVMRYSQNLPNLFLTVATTIFGVPHYCGNRYNCE